ncbi:MAG: Fe-S cluster assembly sulfur transfer protein SufU [Candidatus Izemoplasmatales bacterium]
MANLENLYREVIMEHYKHPRNKGLIIDPTYVSKHIKSPTCIDDITVQSKVENGKVVDCRHDGTGCSICCASASILTEMVIDRTVEEAEKIVTNYINMVTNQPYDSSVDLEEAMAFEEVRLYPARVKCASLSWKAFLDTIKK